MSGDFHIKVRVLAGATLVLLGRSAESGEASVRLPCPSWAVGDSWETSAVTDYGTETVSSIVKSRDGSKIRVLEKRVHQRTWIDPRAPRQVKPPASVASSEIVYEVVGDNIVVRQQTGDVLQMVYEPPAPFCGQIPGTVNFGAKVVVMGNSSVTHSTVIYRALGKRAVTVPAGTFEATVVETQQSMLRNETAPPSGGPSPHIAMTIYAVDKIGVVKSVLVSSTSVPKMSAPANAEADAVLQEGLDKLAKGADASSALGKLQSAAPASRQEYTTVKSEKATELVNYRPAK